MGESQEKKKALHKAITLFIICIGGFIFMAAILGAILELYAIGDLIILVFFVSPFIMGIGVSYGILTGVITVRKQDR